MIYQNGGLLRTSFLCQNYSNCEDLAQNIYRNNLCISANERKVYIYGAEGNYLKRIEKAQTAFIIKYFYGIKIPQLFMWFDRERKYKSDLI